MAKNNYLFFNFKRECFMKQKLFTFLKIAIIVFETIICVNTSTIADDNVYHSYDEILSDLHGLANNNSDLASTEPIGKSLGQEDGQAPTPRDILSIKITKNSNTKPKVLFTGGIHAREWLGIEACRYIAKSLITKYSSDNYVKFLVENAEIWAVPLVNPDGFVYDKANPVNMPYDWPNEGWRKNRHWFDADGDSIGGNRDGVKYYNIDNPRD